MSYGNFKGSITVVLRAGNVRDADEARVLNDIEPEDEPCQPATRRHAWHVSLAPLKVLRVHVADDEARRGVKADGSAPDIALRCDARHRTDRRNKVAHLQEIYVRIYVTYIFTPVRQSWTSWVHAISLSFALFQQRLMIQCTFL